MAYCLHGDQCNTRPKQQHWAGLLKPRSPQGTIQLSSAMKRLIVISCCFLILFAGTASAWASCKQIAFAPDKDHGSKASAHTHDHNSDHEHSQGAVIHCPTLDEFVPVATFSRTKDSRVERLLDVPSAKSDFQFGQHSLYCLIHGPPGFQNVSGIPQYLFLSVLRI
jgi:hypothetical protein